MRNLSHSVRARRFVYVSTKHHDPWTDHVEAEQYWESLLGHSSSSNLLFLNRSALCVGFVPPPLGSQPKGKQGEAAGTSCCSSSAKKSQIIYWYQSSGWARET